MSAGGANIYQWNTSSINPVIVVNPFVSTTYSVTGTNTLTGCTDTKTLTLVVSECTGISNHEKNSFSIYPNPSNGYFYLDFQVTNEMRLTLSVTDISGKTMINQTFLVSPQDDLFKINTEELESGLYFVRISTPDNKFMQMQKVLITK